MADDDAAIREAQRGVTLTEAYGARRRKATARPKPRASAARATPKPAAAAAPKLGSAERADVVDAFVTLLQGLYAHLPLKRAMYAVDPVQRLRLLGQRADALDDLAFVYELSRIVTGLRDAHTRFIGPQMLAGRAAMLPFLVEAYGAPPETRYIASKVAEDRELIGDAHFVAGVELLWWNAVPIDRAVDLYAENETGGRPDSRRARALGSLTLRALQYEPPPDEHWVDVGYRDTKGDEREVRIPWRVVEPGRARTAGSFEGDHAYRYAIDPAAEAARRVKKMLLAPAKWLEDHRGRARSAPTAAEARKAAEAGDPIDTPFQDVVLARAVDTPSGRFGYLRLWSFDLADDEAYLEEVVRLLGLLPPEGLVVDLRANPGGLIWAAERILQLFGPGEIEPTRFSLLATELTRAMAGAPQNEQELGVWRDGLEEAVATGEPYSLAIPITPPERCNDTGQVYGGPVVAVVDANTYSAGDLFAAGFYDNALGTLVTVGEATGAGGANVWSPENVGDALLGTGFEQLPLPGGLAYTLAVRRATRGAGRADGAAIEDVGVRGNQTYAMTERDLVEDNADLLAFCGELLANQPSTQLQVAIPATPAVSVDVTTRGLDRVDVYVDERPQGSRDVADGTTTIELPPTGGQVELRGYGNGELRQRRRFGA